MSRYIPDLLDNEGVPILGRHTGKPDPHNTWWERIQEMENLEQRIQDVVDSNLVLNVSDAFFNSTGSNISAILIIYVLTLFINAS